MLEGLEIAIKKLSDVKENNETFRFDSEYFSKYYLSILERMSHLKKEKLISGCSLITQGPNPTFDNNGYIPCLTGRNIKNGRVEYEGADLVNNAEYSLLKRFQLREGDTLITLKGKGSIGKVGYVTSSIKSIFSRDIGIVRSRSINTAYLNAYLLSRYGNSLVLRGETGGTGQSTLTCSYLKSIEIPRFAIEDEIARIVLESEKALKNANYIYSEAEEILLEELGLKDWKPTSEAVAVKSFADFATSGRLDAEYFQPKYDDVTTKIKQYKGGFEVISRLCKVKDSNFTPLDQNKYKYIELANIGSSGDINGYTHDLGVNLPTRARRIIKKGDVIVSSIEGSLQSCALVDGVYDNAICSTGFYVLEPTSINAETMVILLKSEPMQLLMKKICSGTILTAMNKDEFLSLPVPNIDIDIQQKISKKIQESFALKAESKRLLELAKTAVEVAIEKGEEEALKLLKDIN